MKPTKETPSSNKNEVFSLIRGKFSPEQSKDILLALIDGKISYHNKLNFSHQENFGENNKHSVKRVAELCDDRERILQIIAAASEENYSLKIESDLNIRFITN